MLCLVTGGAGFIGSHLVDALIGKGDEVVVVDSLHAGSRENLAPHLSAGKVRLIEKDLAAEGWQDAMSGVSRVYHLAADPDVRQSSVSPDSQIRNNILATYGVLEAMRSHGAKECIFTSTSTVYGEAIIIPTPENYAPLEPISVYGASKLACEALIASYCHSYAIQAWIFRFANIIGLRSGHGVITDFIRKLDKDPSSLEILGDGTQSKSYLLVEECIQAMLFAAEHARDRVNTFNIGSEDWVSVTQIADIVVEEMGLGRVDFRYTGGSRGWVGDVPRMQLSIERMKRLGWSPMKGSEESVRCAVRALLE